MFFSGKGDRGTTDLLDGSIIEKSDPILELIGTLDELNAFIGLAISSFMDEQLRKDLKHLQTSLSKLMGIIAGNNTDSGVKSSAGDLLIWIEQRISIMGDDIAAPTDFTFPGDSKIGAMLDVCRVVARRAERAAVVINSRKVILENKILPILNRMSSYFYMLRLKYEQ